MWLLLFEGKTEDEERQSALVHLLSTPLFSLLVVGILSSFHVCFFCQSLVWAIQVLLLLLFLVLKQTLFTVCGLFQNFALFQDLLLDLQGSCSSVGKELDVSNKTKGKAIFTFNGKAIII